MIETNPTIPFPASELQESIRTFSARYKELMAYYRCAMMEVETKFRVLSENFSLEDDRNPIEAIKTRMKSPESIRNKLESRNLPMTIESIEKNLNDVAGVRVICGFPGDIYRLAEAFLSQDDVELIERKDYIENPKRNGYRSLHLIVTVPIYLHNKKKLMRVSQYVDSLTGEHMRELLNNPQNLTVFASMPKFETEYDIEMIEVLQEMGMTDAFDWRVTDFSRLGTYNVDGMNICINRVLHKTFISVTEQGTRAGAATAVEMVAEGAMEIVEFKEVVLDRPFVYMLIDCETNLPFFIGTMMNVNGD